MTNYFKLLSRIKEYDNENHIKADNEVISVDDLFNLSYNKFSELKNALSTENLEKKLNNSLNKYLKNFIIKLNTKCNIKYNGENAKLYINLYLLKCKLFSFTINKNFKTNQTKFNIKQNLPKEDPLLYRLAYNIIKDNISIINDKLDGLQEFEGLMMANKESYNSFYEILLKSKNGIYDTQYFRDDFFDVAFNYNLKGKLDYSIRINKNNDEQDIYYKHINNLTPLNEITKQYEGQILKQIPVNILKLDPVLRYIVDEANSKILVRK